MESPSEEKPRPQMVSKTNLPPKADGLDGETAVTLVPVEVRQRQLVPHATTGDLFWESCGGIDAYGNPNYLDLTVIEEDSDSKSQSIRFSQPVVIIGRQEDCDLRLTRREVSRRHAYLQLIGGRWMCVDLGSGNGVRWPSGRHRYGWLEPGGQIGIGPYQITSSLPDPNFQASDPLSSISTNRERPNVYLEFLNAKRAAGGNNGWALRNRVTLIGSHSVCEMQIEDSTIAEFHASLVLTPQGLWLVNLAGQGRTGVNSRPVRWQRLHDGDEVQIGRFRLRTHYGAAEAEVVPQLPDPHSEPLPAVKPPAAAPTVATGVSEGFVLQLMSQVASMQQQFMDHSQQQMMMTLQMLAASRSAPPGLSEELARIQDLTRELEAMREQLNRNLAHTEASRAAVPVAQPVAATPAGPRMSPSGAVGPVSPPQVEATTTRQAIDLETTQLVPKATGHRPAAQVPAPEPLSASSPASPTATVPAQPAAASVPPANAVPPNAARAASPPLPPEEQNRRTREEVEMHAALLEGMARLEAERTSTWSRIVKTLMGTPQ